jgi:UrcA family protein
MLNKTTLLAAALAFGLASVASASPAPASDPDVASTTVSLAGLDLHTEAGAKTAYHRIRQAAQDVCLAETDARPVLPDASQPSCLTLTANRAIATLGSPMVSALNSGHRDPGAQFAAGGR